MRKVQSDVILDENGFIPESMLNTSSVTPITFAQLTAVDAELTPGNRYRIGDFVTKEIAHGSTTELITGIPEPLIVTAITTNKIGKIAFSELHPTDYIEYDVTDVLCEDGTTPRLGRITRRIDKYGNSTPWDFRNVKHEMILLEAPNWDDGVSYLNGSLVRHNGFIWKAAAKATEATPSNNTPISGSKYWIKFLPIGSYLLPAELLAVADQSTNIGSCSNDGVAYGAPIYLHTFSKYVSPGVYVESSASAFQNCELGEGCSNIAFIVSGAETYQSIKIGDYSTQMRFSGGGLNTIFGMGCERVINWGECRNCNFDARITKSIFNSSFDSTINGLFAGNIILSMANGVLFSSETVYNNIDSIANGTAGSDLWGCRIVNLVYFTLAYRFTDSFVGNSQLLSTLSSFFNSEIDGITNRITILGSITDSFLPDATENLLIESSTEYGLVLSAPQLAKLPGKKHVKIVGDDDDGFFVIERNSSGIEVIT